MRSGVTKEAASSAVRSQPVLMVVGGLGGTTASVPEHAEEECPTRKGTVTVLGGCSCICVLLAYCTIIRIIYCFNI